MRNAINEVLSRTSTKTADYTYADLTVKYSENVTSQTTIENKLNDVLKFCDHVSYWEGNTLHIIDLIVGGATYTLSAGKIKNVTSRIDTSIISSFKASYEYRVHDDGGISSPPTLTRDTNDITLSTGIDGGIEKNINSKMSAASLTGSIISYDTTDLSAHLTRKKTLSLREPVTIISDGFLTYNIGDKISYDTAYESGYLIIESIVFNEDKLETTLYGRGQYTGKAP